METTRDVILDLLPLYLSDEASADTRALVEQHLAADPELAHLADQWRRRLPQTPPPPVNPESQALAYQEARQRIFNRMVTLAIIIAVGAIALGGAALMGAMFLIKM